MATAASVRLQIRRHMVCSRPSSRELERRTPIVLTERDKEILKAVHTHGFLTSELVELAFFPQPPQRRASPSTCALDRLRYLWLWEYVDRVELPVSRHLGGRRPFLYTLGRRGVPVVQTLLPADAPLVHTRRLDRLVDTFVDHDLLVASFWANLTALLRGSGATSFTWLSEREMRGRKWWVQSPHTGRRLPFLPDGYFAIGTPDEKVQSVFVEVDMGTLTKARFQRKVTAFEEWRLKGRHERVFGLPDFQVVILVPSFARMDQLTAVVQHEVLRDRLSAYRFATFEALDPGEFADADWESPDGETYWLVPPEVLGRDEEGVR